jgi:hypothetical protein
MNQHRPLLLLASIALATSVLGACSQGHSSPTEPSLSLDSAKSFAADSTSADDPAGAVAGDAIAKRHGGDDGNDNGGGGNDDGTLDQGGGNDDDPAGDDNNNNNQRRNRGRNGGGNGNGGNQQPRAPRGGQEFEATVRSVAGSTITLVTGTRVVVNGQTQWSARGDLRTLPALANAVAANRAPRIEGRGTRQADGSILALTIKAEIDE